MKQEHKKNIQCIIFEASMVLQLHVEMLWVMIPCSAVVNTKVSEEDTSAKFRVECVHWILLAHDTDKWRALVNIAILKIKIRGLG